MDWLREGRCAPLLQLEAEKEGGGGAPALGRRRVVATSRRPGRSSAGGGWKEVSRWRGWERTGMPRAQRGQLDIESDGAPLADGGLSILTEPLSFASSCQDFTG